MARPEITGRKNAVARLDPTAPDETPDCFSVEEFCRRHRLSVQAFYKHADLMPASFYIGSRRLITKEAAARWRAEREAVAESEAT